MDYSQAKEIEALKIELESYMENKIQPEKGI